jgi:hypothetical protein
VEWRGKEKKGDQSDAGKRLDCGPSCRLSLPLLIVARSPAFFDRFLSIFVEFSPAKENWTE